MINKDYLNENESQINSATKVAEVEKTKNAKAKKEALFVAAAEANISQEKDFKQELEFARKNYDILLKNYEKLEEMLEAQIEANKEAKKELNRSRRLNLAMLIIAIISTIAGPIVSVLVSK